MQVKYVQVRMSQELHKRLKVEAVNIGITLSAHMLDLLSKQE